MDGSRARSPSLRYGFKQTEGRSAEGGAYHHWAFKRGEPEYLVHIRRAPAKRRQKNRSTTQKEHDEPALPPPEPRSWLASSAVPAAVRRSEPLPEHLLAVADSLGFDRTARAAVAAAAPNSPRSPMGGRAHGATPPAMIGGAGPALAWHGGQPGGPFYAPPQPLAAHGFGPFGAAHAAPGMYSQPMHSAGAAMAPLGAFSLGYGPVLAYAPALHAHPPFMAMMPPTYPLAPMGFGGGVIMGSAMGAPPPIIAETDRGAAATLAAHTAAFATAPLPHALPRSAGAKRPRDEGPAESHAHSRPKSSGSIIDAAHDRARSSRPETPDAG